MAKIDHEASARRAECGEPAAGEAEYALPAPARPTRMGKVAVFAVVVVVIAVGVIAVVEVLH